MRRSSLRAGRIACLLLGLALVVLTGRPVHASAMPGSGAAIVDSSGPGSIQGIDSTRTDSTSVDKLSTTTEPERLLQLTIAGGLSARITPGFEVDEGVDYESGGAAAIARISVRPEHLLRLGLESGYYVLSAANERPGQNRTPSRLVLTTIPLLLTASMGNDRFEIGSGIGLFQLLVSAGTSEATSFASEGIDLGYVFSGSWHEPIFDGVDLGLHARFYEFVDRPITIVMLGLGIRFDVASL